MNNPLVSIIVPVYNVQNSVARCLESICAQTWKDIEVILVNDGSRDESFSICEQFREKDPRIVLVDKSNSGVSETRNCGSGLAPLLVGDAVLLLQKGNGRKASAD